MEWESLMIEGHEFLVKKPLTVTPVREEPVQHICVCLLIQTIDGGENHGKTTQDKCHQVIGNPDQAFCDDCMDSEHHLAQNQLGLGRHLHKRSKDA